MGESGKGDLQIASAPRAVRSVNDGPGDCSELTQENWRKVHYVLSGQCDDGVGLDFAAGFAGVRAKDIRAWVKRSREKYPNDEPWIHDIAVFWDEEKNKSQASRMEDELWKLAKGGNQSAAARLLAVRDERYKKESKGSDNMQLDSSAIEDIFKGIAAAKRLEQVDSEAPKTIEVIPNKEGDLI